MKKSIKQICPHGGAVAAPISGAAFSKIILKKLEILGVHLSEITLHIGLGTFDQ